MTKCQGSVKCPSRPRFRLTPVGQPDKVVYVCGTHTTTVFEALLSLPGVTHIRGSKGVSW